MTPAEGAGACELELDVAPAAEGVCVRGSESLLHRMAVNLVGNSFRHNPQGCRVTVSLDVRGGLLGTPLGRRLVLVVSDDGRGLGADALAALGRRPGSDLLEHGLGLVIVRRIAAAHGGDARFSNNAGGGVPLRRDPARRTPPYETHSQSEPPVKRAPAPRYGNREAVFGSGRGPSGASSPGCRGARC